MKRRKIRTQVLNMMRKPIPQKTLKIPLRLILGGDKQGYIGRKISSDITTPRIVQYIPIEYLVTVGRATGTSERRLGELMIIGTGLKITNQS